MSFEGRPGTRHLYGDVFCEAIEQLQRDALDRPRPELVVRVDRSGLNEHHPIVVALHAAIDHVLRPIVAAEERRAGARLIGAARAVTARDQVGLRALNDLLRAAFDQPGTAGAEQGDTPTDKSPQRGSDQADAEPEAETEPEEEPEADITSTGAEAPAEPVAPTQALWFKQSPVRLHPGEKRTVTLLADPSVVEPGTAVELEAAPGLTVMLRTDTMPEPGSRGMSAVAASVRARG